MDRALIELDEVSKSFAVYRRAGLVRRRREVVDAVKGVTFSIAAGSMVGYIGPNGAGKSTTIKMLIGILVPSSGQVRIDGRDPSRDRRTVAGQIGVVFGQRSQLWWDLPLVDSFDLLRHIYRVPAADHRSRQDMLADLLDMGGFLSTPVRQLSLGQRMRGELAAAMLHNPSLLFLDEPTIGLDVVSKDAVRRFLTHLNREQGTTVLLTTHDLADVEHLCERLMVIDHGSVIEDATVDDIKDRYGHHRTLVVDLEQPGPTLTIDGVETFRVDGPRQWLRFDRSRHTASSLLAHVSAQADVRDITVEEPDIDAVVRQIYSRGSAPVLSAEAFQSDMS